MRRYDWDHIHYRTADAEAIATFFERFFGASVKRDVYPPGTLYPGQKRIAIDAGGQRILLAPKHPDDPTAAAPPFPYFGLEHVGFTVDDVDAACEELRAQGADIAIGPLTRSPGLRLAFVRGPEGIMVEIVQK
ncbi:MAG TPA: VOC family protein [Rhodopila sp.]|uniref:VOC family protein n=1 Tax=Rhodopila sp. TaxID=2480087 RepID=UPI002CBB8DF3|nr:VOC family protein [Rhodopila sp.]HVY18429.1 VOC family protein [Rhodopila sp.]